MKITIKKGYVNISSQFAIAAQCVKPHSLVSVDLSSS